MDSINNLLNYHLQNSYLNLTNSISLENLLILIKNIKKLNIVITHINMPFDFNYKSVVKEYFPEININE
jgi:hypothetical protein